MPLPIEEFRNQQGIEATNRALMAELAMKFEEAQEHYKEASQLLQRAIPRISQKSEERRRVEWQFKFVEERRRLLAAFKDGTGYFPEPLPSFFTIQREGAHNTPGLRSLTAIELGLRRPLSESTSLPPGLQNLPSPPLYSLFLPTSLPEITYHVYCEQIQRSKGIWIYLHIKNADKTQTLYSLDSFRKPTSQFSKVTLNRCAEYHNPCISISISPVEVKWQYMSDIRDIGRPFKMRTEDRRELLEAPDRLDKGWNPRRFTYGGQRFVWKDSKTKTNAVSVLYEVIREWPDPKSKTGKMLDEVHPRPLVWGEAKFAKDKVCTIHMVGGLDQRFREFLLASELTKQLVQIHD